MRCPTAVAAPRPRTKPVTPCARVAVGVVALGLLAGGSHAAGLFLPVDQAGAAVDGPPAAGSPFAPRATALVPEMWERRVRIARPALTAAREGVANAGAGRLLLNVRDGVRLDVVVERTAPTKWGYSLSGRVVGRHGGFVTLVVHEEAVAGSIWTPHAAYDLSYQGGSAHRLRDVTNAPSFECGGAAHSGRFAGDVTVQRSRAGQAPGKRPGNDDGSVVDILVVWTPTAREKYHSGPQVRSQIDMLVAYANDALERSGALVSLNLVAAEEVDYLETDTRTDFHRLVVPDDGHMDRVHDRRDALGADLVFLLGSDYGFGLAQTPGAFSVGWASAVLFAHEVGHNFGIGHERYISNKHRHAHGFTTDGCDYTIMSYGQECNDRTGYRPPYFASPWRYSLLDGRALGVTRFAKERGVRGPADAVLTLNQNRHGVANLRPSRSGE